MDIKRRLIPFGKYFPDGGLINTSRARGTQEKYNYSDVGVTNPHAHGECYFVVPMLAQQIPTNPHTHGVHLDPGHLSSVSPHAHGEM